MARFDSLSAEYNEFFESFPASEKALYYIPFVVAPISFFSSIFMCYLLLLKKNDKRIRQRPRDQLLLGISVLDTLGSFGLSFSTVPGPRIETQIAENLDNPGRQLPTFGTIGTCTAQGFFVHMGLGVPLYNAALCIYYVLRIRYRYTDRLLAKRMTPIAHCFILAWTFGTGITALILKLFNYAGYLGCWIGSADAPCQAGYQEFCSRGRNKSIFELYFAILPVVVSFVVVVCSMILIYCTVRATEVRSQAWQVQGIHNNPTSTVSQNSNSSFTTSRAPTTTTAFSSSSSSSLWNNHTHRWWSSTAGLSTRTVSNASTGDVPQQPPPQTCAESQPPQPEAPPPPLPPPPPPTLPPPQETTIRRLRPSMRTTSIVQPQRRSSLPLTQRTMETGLLYSGAFLLVYFPLALTGEIPIDSDTTFYKCLRATAVFFFPLQGFFNMLIYTSPVWWKWLPHIKNRILHIFYYYFCRLAACYKSSNDNPNNENESSTAPFASTVSTSHAPSSNEDDDEENDPTTTAATTNATSSASKNSSPFYSTPRRSLNESTASSFWERASTTIQLEVLPEGEEEEGDYEGEDEETLEETETEHETIRASNSPLEASGIIDTIIEKKGSDNTETTTTSLPSPVHDGD